MGQMDIRRFPVLLTDGQEFGIRKVKDTEGLEKPDDFQTEEDQKAQEEFSIMKEAERKKRAAEKASSSAKRGYDNAGVVINLADEDDEEL